MYEYYASSRKVAGSIPHDVTGIFNLPNPSSHILDLDSTHSITETSIRNLPKYKARSLMSSVSRLSRTVIFNLGYVKHLTVYLKILKNIYYSILGIMQSIYFYM
jgi:hypothetical protein